MTAFRNPLPALVYILHSGNLYGTERMALATLEGMSEYQRRILFATAPAGNASVIEAARDAGYDTVTFETKWQLLKGIVPLFLKHRAIDVIGVGVAAHFVCHVLGRLLGVKVRQLQVAHGGTADHDSYGRKHPLNKIPVGIIAVSDFVKQKLVQHGVRADRVSVIENFLSGQQQSEHPIRPSYAGAGAGTRQIDHNRIKVAVVSRVDGIKKIDLLVAALEKFGLPNFQFDVYGTGGHLDSLRERSAPLSNLHFHGYVPDVSARLAQADLLLHLCPEEPFGLVILEAFSSRLVVIVPDAGGASSLVEHGVTGLRFRANDLEDIRQKLEDAARMSPGQLQRMAEAGAATLDNQFSQQQGIRRYREAFQLAA